MVVSAPRAVGSRTPKLEKEKQTKHELITRDFRMRKMLHNRGDDIFNLTCETWKTVIRFSQGRFLQWPSRFCAHQTGLPRSTENGPTHRQWYSRTNIKVVLWLFLDMGCNHALRFKTSLSAPPRARTLTSMTHPCVSLLCMIVAVLMLAVVLQGMCLGLKNPFGNRSRKKSVIKWEFQGFYYLADKYYSLGILDYLIIIILSGLPVCQHLSLSFSFRTPFSVVIIPICLNRIPTPKSKLPFSCLSY